MKLSIGKFDAVRGTVPVVFEEDSRRHQRDVNAVVDLAGKLDRKATRSRIEEVSAGVSHKFALGVIGEPVAAQPAAPAGE